MATYTVIQDIEAEDKLFGPLTLKQFIFACITVVSGYLSFWSIINDLAFLLIVFLPPTLFFGSLAFPWSKDQPTEVWMMAKLRYYFRPRKRIWDQAGIKELVTITVPKKEEKHYTDGLSNTEVKSRLKALADTIDTRGRAATGANLVAPLQQQQYAGGQTDRLINTNVATQAPNDYDQNDMFDERGTAEAHKLDEMIQKSTTAHRDEILEKISTARSHTENPAPQNPAPTITQPKSPKTGTQTQQNTDYWFMRQPEPPKKSGYATYGASQVVTPGQKTNTTPSNGKELTPEEKQALEKIHQNQSRPNPSNSHLKTIKPLSEQEREAKEAAATRQSEPKTQQSPSTQKAQTATDTETPGNQTAKADILGLAQNDDLNVETIARQAKKQSEPPADEVVVSLH